MPLARLTALVSDEGLSQLRASRALRQRCKRLESWQQRTCQAPDRWRNRIDCNCIRELEKDLPALALQLPMPESEQTGCVDGATPRTRCSIHRTPVDGNGLLTALEIEPGPRLGRLLHHLKLEHAFERIQTPSEALKEAQHFLALGSEAL